MNDILQIAEFLLTGALVFVVVALICDIVILTARKSAVRATRTTRQKVAVGAGVGRSMADAGPAGNADAGRLVGDPGRAARTSPARAAASGSKAGRLATYATAFTLVAFALVTVYLGIRVAKTGHGPFANQHEFAVSFVWGILAAYLLVEWRYKMRMLSVVVLPVSGCLLLYAMRLDAGVETLVPALQNNLLLTMHVGFAILAYGAACVSFGSAVLYLLYPKLKFLSSRRREVFDEVGYKAAVVTFPLLTIMIVLGAIWADTAWGRYWGWDPKETAALVTWLIYGAFLHARVVRGWQGKKSAWLLVIGFAAVLFAYFGNHFFGGLHSYV